MKLLFEHIAFKYFGVKSTKRGNNYYKKRYPSSVEEHHLFRHQLKNNLDDLIIRRIFPLERFRELLNNQTMALINPNKWTEDDKFENYVFNSEILNPHSGEYEYSPFKDQFYAQCWSYGYENDAMWKLYSGNQNGIMVETKVGNIKNLVNNQMNLNKDDFALGRVAYLHKEDLKQMIKEHKDGIRDKAFGDDTVVGAIITLLVKLYAYNHEKEIRLVFHNKSNHSEDFENGILMRDIDSNEFITKVTIDPRIEEEEGIDLKSEFARVIEPRKLFHSNLKKREPLRI